MSSFGIVASGLTDLKQAFSRASSALQRRITRAAMNKSITPVLKSIKSLAPRETGQLKHSLARVVRTYPRSGVVIGIVGIRADSKSAANGRNPAKYLHLIELGVRPHRVGKGSRLRRKSGSKRLGRPELQAGGKHPGVAGRHFLKRGFELVEGQASSILTSEITVRLAREFMNRG